MRANIDAIVVEQAPELREIGAGVALWPGAIAVLTELDLGDRVRALGGDFEIGGLRSHDGAWLLRYSRAELVRALGGPVMGVHRGELQALLYATLPRGMVQTGKQCIGVDNPWQDGVRVRFSDGSSVVGRAVIGADGQRSAVRESIAGNHLLHDCQYV